MSELNSATQKELKLKIADSFGQAASYYDLHAEVPREVADRLIASLQPWKDIIPQGPIAELGAGTGFVTEGLANLYPDREIEAIDISDQMVSLFKDKFSDRLNVIAQVADAEEIPYNDPDYALTVSGFTAHWFKDPAQTLAQWLEITKPGGLLLAAFPGNESFPTWQQHCKELGLPFTANTLPDVEEMVIKMSVGPAQVDYYEDTISQSFESASDFFEELKKLGMGTQIQGRHLTSEERKLLVEHWDDSATGNITVRYHMVFLAVKRDFDS